MKSPDPQKEIREVLSAKEFGYYREAKGWQYRAAPDASAPRDLSWFVTLGQAFAKVGEALLWVLAGGLLAYALWWAARMLPQLRAPPEEPYRPPAALFGMSIGTVIGSTRRGPRSRRAS